IPTTSSAASLFYATTGISANVSHSGAANANALLQLAVLATFLVHPHNRVQAADCRRLLNGRGPAKVSEILGPGPSTREEIRLLNRWVRTVTSTVGRGGHRVGQII